jgi:hypothetical protein
MQIWDLFQGYEKAHGRYNVQRVNESGKNEGKARTILEPASQDLWDVHLSGSGPGLGIIPLMANNTIIWACIDVDINNINHSELEKLCRRNKMPLVVCRSKSGGAHLFLFFKEPVEAKPVMDILSFWASVLGYGGSEVFPKQSSRYDEQDIGNWLNMPYYYADKTTRYCIHDGMDLDLNDFVEFAESMITTLEEIQRIHVPLTMTGNESLNEGLFEEGPPCLQRLFAMGGFPQGTRNEGMYNCGVYLKKRFGDDWADKMPEYNLEMCDPKLTLTELTTLVKSGGKKDYEYKCKKPPIAAFCDRRLCQSRRYGVGETTEGRTRPEVNDVKKVIGDPTLWFMTIGGHRMLFMTEEILSQPKWKARVADELNRVLKTVPQDRWERWLDDLLSNCDVEYAPEDATPLGQFRILLDTFLIAHARTTTRDQLAESNAPYLHEGEIWFKLEGLKKFLKNNGYDFKTSNHLSEMLKSPEIKATNHKIRILGRDYHIWKIKEPDHATNINPEANFGTEEF